jgi:CubicO group peptidase (beta-lactamase class C family)
MRILMAHPDGTLSRLHRGAVNGGSLRQLMLAAAGILCCAASAAGAPADPRIAELQRDIVPAVMLQGAPVPHRSLQEAMTQAKVPGVSIAFISGGRIAWTRSYGTTCDDKEKVTASTRFQAG